MTPEHMVKAIACTAEGAAHPLLISVLPKSVCEQLPMALATRGAYTDVAVSAEAFDLLQNAKNLARSGGMDHVTTIHYMRAVLDQPENSGYAWLESQSASMDQLIETLESSIADEPYEKRLLQSSSRDQDSFFQCSPDEIQQWEKRLGPILERSRDMVRGAAREELPFGFASQPEGSGEQHGGSPSAGFSQFSQIPPVSATAPVPPPQPLVRRIDLENPDWEIMEQIADLLLEGHLVAFPSETGFLVVGDATNTATMRELRALTHNEAGTGGSAHVREGEMPKEPVALIHGMTQLKNLVPIDEKLMEWMETVWPGPVTVITKRLPRALTSLTRETTLALRMPADPLTLSVLSTAGRPLAAIQANEIVRPKTPQISTEEILDELTGRLAMILDPGVPVPDLPAKIVHPPQKL